MTRPELRAACDAFTVTAPVSVEDCREIYAELRSRMPLGIPLEVHCIDERTIRVTAGDMGCTYSVELQAKS